MSFHRRVVVTGIGAITPLGPTFEHSWKSLLASESGITTLREALLHQHGNDPSSEAFQKDWEYARSLPCQVAASVPNVKCRDTKTPRFVELALRAADGAMDASRLKEWLAADDDDDDDDNVRKDDAVLKKDRVGVCIGSGMSSVREVVDTYRTLETRGYRRLSPHFVPKVLTNSAAGRVSIEHGLRGPNHAVSTACAAGSHAIGDAMRCIQYNNADIMLAGGAESCIDPLSIAGFCRLRALSTRYQPTSSEGDARSAWLPQQSSRPFDGQRDGFVMGEGAAVLVLEEYEHALRRDAPILAEICGYGLTGDAFHSTAPDENGSGAQRAMRMALEQAKEGLQRNESTGGHTPGAAVRSDGGFTSNIALHVGYVNAHATSTPKGDDIEARVIQSVLQSSLEQSSSATSSSTSTSTLTSTGFTPHVSSTKGASGHLLGAAGALEAAFTVQSLVDQMIPPTLNLDEPPPQDEYFFRLNSEPTPTNGDLETAINNSFGFGGTNASLVFRRV